jgi:SAM-dependent methyltransferase
VLAWMMRRLRFDPRTVAYVSHDVARLAARLRLRTRPVPEHARKLHLGCGDRRVDGWLNCDVSGSEFDLDLAVGQLPFPNGSTDVIVMQHVIEHLNLHDQLIPLFHELYRICAEDGRLWLSCPDLAKVCAAYLHDRGRALEEDRRRRWSDYSLGGAPVQHFINDVFHGKGMHRNLSTSNSLPGPSTVQASHPYNALPKPTCSQPTQNSQHDMTTYNPSMSS